MHLSSALQDLLEEGRVRLSAADAFSAEDLHRAEDVLRTFERGYRRDMPCTPPAFSMPAVLWAAEMFYRACQCLAFREIDAAEMIDMLSHQLSGETGAAAHYSVDLTFRLLPDLFQRTKAAARDDPLLQQLQSWANAWPLSSVGINGVESGSLEPILDNACLRLLYVDRIIARKDIGRLSDSRVRDAVLEAVGLHEELAPQVIAAAKELAQKCEYE